MVSLSFLLSHASMLNWNVKSTQCYLSKRGFISWDVTQKRAPHKGQLLLARVAHQELDGDPQHTHMILWPPPKDILLHPLGSLSLLKWRHSSWFTRPPVLVLSLISGCTGHVKLPQRAGQLLSVPVSSSESLHHHTDAREEAGTFCRGESPTKASARYR